jgi:hypothetical protein
MFDCFCLTYVVVSPFKMRPAVLNWFKNSSLSCFDFHTNQLSYPKLAVPFFSASISVCLHVHPPHSEVCLIWGWISAPGTGWHLIVLADAIQVWRPRFITLHHWEGKNTYEVFWICLDILGPPQFSRIPKSWFRHVLMINAINRTVLERQFLALMIKESCPTSFHWVLTQRCLLNLKPLLFISRDFQQGCNFTVLWLGGHILILLFQGHCAAHI